VRLPGLELVPWWNTTRGYQAQVEYGIERREQHQDAGTMTVRDTTGPWWMCCNGTIHGR
jgi:hypothetical protein